MSRKRNDFARTWASLTDLGTMFGISRVAVGKELTAAGWRDAHGTPTAPAKEGEHYVSTPLKDGTPYYRWSRGKVRELLLSHGYLRQTPQEMRDIEREAAMREVEAKLRQGDIGEGEGRILADAIEMQHADAIPLPSSTRKRGRDTRPIRITVLGNNWSDLFPLDRVEELLIPRVRPLADVVEPIEQNVRSSGDAQEPDERDAGERTAVSDT